MPDPRDHDPLLQRMHDLERSLAEASAWLVEAFEAKQETQRRLRNVDDRIDYRKAWLVTEGHINGASEDKRKHALKRAECEDPELVSLERVRHGGWADLDDAELQIKRAEAQLSLGKLELRGLHATLAYLGGPA